VIISSLSASTKPDKTDVLRLIDRARLRNTRCSQSHCTSGIADGNTLSPFAERAGCMLSRAYHNPQNIIEDIEVTLASMLVHCYYGPVTQSRRRHCVTRTSRGSSDVQLLMPHTICKVDSKLLKLCVERVRRIFVRWHCNTKRS
jgi:hypothetical protein